MAAPQFIAVADAGAPVASTPKTQPERAVSPEPVRSDRSISPFRETGAAGTRHNLTRPAAGRTINATNARHCFRPAYVPSTTCSTATGRDCLAANTASPEGELLLAALSQTVAFEAPA